MVIATAGFLVLVIILLVALGAVQGQQSRNESKAAGSETDAGEKTDEQQAG